MKICAQCQLVSPDGVMQCPGCASILFEDSPFSENPELASPSEPGMLSWDFTFKWVFVVVGATFLVETILTGVAYLFARSGVKDIARGVAMSQNVFVPLMMLFCFIWLSSTTRRSFARACSVYLWSLMISIVLTAVSRGALLSTFGWLLIGFAPAIVGAAGGNWARRPLK